MFKKRDFLETAQEINPENGSGKLFLTKMSASIENFPEKIRTFALAKLEPGGEVGYHEHHGESETYYILKGSGKYNDNGTIRDIVPGDLTFTPDGEGHGIKNTSDDVMEFIALIVEE